MRGEGPSNRLVLADDPNVQVNVELYAAEGGPLEGPYELTYHSGAGRETRSGQLSGGKVNAELPALASSVELFLPELGLRMPLQLGHLDPTHDEGSDSFRLTGVQARLHALGYYGGPIDGEATPAFTSALTRFQQIELERDDAAGELDAATCTKLVELCGA